MSAKIRTALYAGLLSAASALWSVAGWAADPSPPAGPAPGGPPSFISLPHHAGLTQSLVKGWHTFPLKAMPRWHALPIEEKAGGGGPPGGGGGGTGGYRLQPTYFLSLPPESALLSEINTSLSATSLGYTYKGETAITFASSTGLLVGGYNELPSVCGGFIECAPGATVASISTLRLLPWATSVLPLNIGTCFFFCNFLGYDPSLAVSSDHKTILYSYGVCGADGACLSGSLMIATSTDGTNWTNHEVTSSINNALLTGFVDDKPYLAADPVNPGRAYVAWDRNAMVVNPRTRRITQTQIVYLAQTNDGGVDWSNPPNQYTNTVSPNAVSNPNNLQGRVIDAMPAVRPDGTVYVVWMDYSQTPARLFLNSCTPSTDPSNPIPTCDSSYGHSIVSLNAAATTDIGCNGGRAISPSPSIAVVTATGTGVPNGRLYVTFADIPSGASTYSILLMYSDDGGTSWSGPYRLNDDGAQSRQHYFPALSVVGSTVYVSWLDRRNDPSDCLTQTFSTYSDGTLTSGLNVAPNRNVSDSTGGKANQSDYDGNANGPGDYSGTVGLALGGNNLQYPLWPDHPTTPNTAFEIFTEEVTRP